MYTFPRYFLLLAYSGPYEKYKLLMSKPTSEIYPKVFLNLEYFYSLELELYRNFVYVLFDL